MQTFQLPDDIKVFGVQASSFPAGVQQAWQALHKLLPTTAGRTFYGISHGSAMGIVYKACVQQLTDGEAERLGCKSFVIPKGEYRGEVIENFMQQISKIGETFQALLALGDYDPAGACIEKYLNEEDVICMLRQKKAAASV